MKTLLIHSEEEKALAEGFQSLLLKTDIQVEPFPVNIQEGAGKGIEKMVNIFSARSASGAGDPDIAPTHVAIISVLAPVWIDFLAGLSCGSKAQLLVYGEEAVKSIPEVFNFCFKILTSEEELLDYLKAEWEYHKKIEINMGANAARDVLLKMGTSVNEKSMVNCVCEGSSQELLFFLAAGFSPNTRNKAGVPLLNIAARDGNREIIRLLFSAGAEINIISDDRGTSALIDSVMAKHYELVVDFIKAGADLNIQSKNGQTALVVATGAGNKKAVEALLKAGADPDIADSMGMSARKYAALFHKNTLAPVFDTYAPQEGA
jgi:hypothetical protein